MKSPIELTLRVLDELGTLGGVCTTQDKKTILSRFEHEGLSFLTITLADFAKDLQKGLARGAVDSSLFTGFSRGRGELPRFLGGFLCRVFDEKSGNILDDPHADSVFAVFQICNLTSKILLPTTRARRRKAFRNYILIEDAVRRADRERTEADYLAFSRAARLLFWEPLSKVELMLVRGEHVPKHGPGATAEKLSGNAKFMQRTWPIRLEYDFPALDFVVPGARYYKSLNRVQYLDPGHEYPVRVIDVPKTLKTPRIIAIEPVAMQYTQQSLLAPLVHHLERDHLLDGMVGFTDRLPNQEMARIGSIDGSLATLDLSDASDRVSNQLALSLFESVPQLSHAVQACRSRKADVPGVGVVRLAKFASMGSALCFPIEAMVFLAVIFVAIAESEDVPLDRHLVKKWRSKVRVYGDDIIVPTHFAEAVIARLESFGFKVNTNKSFWTGRFRESCGAEYFAGRDVSIVRQRRLFPSSRRRVEEVVGTVKLRNLLYWRGLHETVEWLDQQLAEVLPHFPIVEPTSSLLGRESVMPARGEKIDPHLHVPLVKGYAVTSPLPISRLDGEAALMKWFLKQSREPLAQDHLERAGRPKQPYLKLRWKPPF